MLRSSGSRLLVCVLVLTSYTLNLPVAEADDQPAYAGTFIQSPSGFVGCAQPFLSDVPLHTYCFVIHRSIGDDASSSWTVTAAHYAIHWLPALYTTELLSSYVGVLPPDAVSIEGNGSISASFSLPKIGDVTIEGSSNSSFETFGAELLRLPLRWTIGSQGGEIVNYTRPSFGPVMTITVNQVVIPGYKFAVWTGSVSGPWEMSLVF